MLKLIGPFTSAVSLSGCPLKGPISDSDVQELANAGLLVSGSKIHRLGSFTKLKSGFPDAELIAIKGDACLVPGFIDAHTHIAFGGSRARDFALRNAGVSYLEISRQGGGIWDTVQRTREASASELQQFIISRTHALSKKGITTVEVKSGYGLSVEEESKMLASIRSAKENAEIDIFSTCLAAHIKPKDYKRGSSEYLREMSVKLLPKLKSEFDCHRVDIFIEKTAFQIEESRVYLKSAQDLGLDIVIHADQFTPMGSHLAVELGAVSADHLEASGDQEIENLANSNVVAIALPGASVGLGEPFTPARKLLDAGSCLAIASDWNPGSAPMGDLVTQASIMATYEKLSCSEILAGITYRAAHALRLEDRGRLEEGKLADFNIYQVKDFLEIFYHQGSLLPAQVWKKGARIV